MSAALVAGAPRSRPPARDRDGGGDGADPPGRESYLAALAVAARVVAGTPVVRTALLVLAGSTFVVGLGEVLLPLVARDLLGIGEAGAGYLTAATGCSPCSRSRASARLCRPRSSR